MSKYNAVKFKAIVKKANLKVILMFLFDLNVQVKYPNLANAKDEIPIRGICLIDDFEEVIDSMTPENLCFCERLDFQQNVNFKLIEIEQNPVELPTGCAKEVSEKQANK